MRAESLAATEADFFKNTPRPSKGNAEALERALCPAARIDPHTPRKKDKHVHPLERTRGARSQFCSSIVRRVRRSGGGHASSTICSESSSTSGATTARWYEAFQTREAASPPTFRKARRLSSIEGTQTFGRRPDARKRKSPLSSFCRSVGRRCFAWHSRDVPRCWRQSCWPQEQVSPKPNDRSEHG